MVRKIAFHIALFVSISGQAQYLSAGGDFSIDQRRSCYNLTVTVTNINPGSGVILYQYEGKSSPVVADTFYTYTTAGSYWLYQYIQGPTGQKADSILVEIMEPQTPAFALNTCNGNGVQVVLDDTYYDVYEINYGDGTIIQVPVNTFPPLYTYAGNAPVNVSVTGLFTTANNRCGSASQPFTPLAQVVAGSLSKVEVIDNQTIVVNYNQATNTVTSLEVSINGTGNYQKYKNLTAGNTVDTLRNLLPAEATYCFRLVSHDACSNFKAYSTEVCTIYANIKAVNSAINLNWQTVYPGSFNNLDVYRDNNLLTSLTGTPLTFSDSTAICNLSYCYRVQANYSGGALSVANQVCATAFSTDNPPPVTDISAQYDNNQITWRWQPPANDSIKTYYVYSGAGNLVDTTAQTTLSVEEKLSDNCIRVTAENICGNRSATGNPVCPLVVEGTTAADGTVNLRWNSYTGWQNGVNTYKVVIYDANQVRTDSLDVSTQTTYDHPLPAGNEQVSYYRIWAIANDANLPYSYSNLLRVERPPIIGIPNSFTPNGDNINDLFIIDGKYVQSVQLKIFNRWGNLIYAADSNAWDGTVNGQKVPLGTYIYQAIIKDFAGNEHIREGSVLILKN